MTGGAPPADGPDPNRGRENLLWFVGLGCGIGFLFDHALLGALAGFGAWAVRRGAGEGRGERTQGEDE